MTVKEFKEQVAAIPDELDDQPIVMQEDPEGNGYRTGAGIDTECYFSADGGNCGEVYDLDEDEDELPDNIERCVVIYPA